MIILKNKNGKQVALLNPSEKANKFAVEMRTGIKHTNFGEFKRKKNGALVNLNTRERAYRAGFLQHARESQIIWCKENGVKSKAIANSKKYWHKRKEKSLNKAFKNYDKVYGK